MFFGFPILQVIQDTLVTSRYMSVGEPDYCVEKPVTKLLDMLIRARANRVKSKRRLVDTG